MEYVVFALALIAVAVYGIWRVRRGGSVDDRDRAIQGLPDDLRDKSYGLDANTHRILELAKGYGVATFPTFNTGDNVAIIEGDRMTYSDSGPTGTAGRSVEVVDVSALLLVGGAVLVVVIVAILVWVAMTWTSKRGE